jgi:hypothetical protein
MLTILKLHMIFTKVMEIELALTFMALLVAFLFPRFGSSFFLRAESSFSRLAQRKKLSVVLVFLFALGARAAILPILPIPQPHIDDEFSYLLGADTFLHGRLANPPHPMWIHFETFHVIQQPTYASKYPPAQALILAAGRLLTGRPFVGVWFSTGLMCAAICWMLQAWVSPSWALVGGIIAVVRLGLFTYWVDGYWGGAAAALGGALVLGALPRIFRSRDLVDTLLLGLGIAILANSRPFEGFVFCIPVAIALFVWLFRKNGSEFWLSVRRVILPVSIVLLMVAFGMAYYFWRVTGNPFRMPYQVSEDTYSVAPTLIWQPLKPVPPYRTDVLRDFYLGEGVRHYRIARNPVGAIIVWMIRIGETVLFYFGFILLVPLVISILIWLRGSAHRRWSERTTFLIALTAFSVVGIGVEVFYFPHYTAPMVGLLFLILMISMREIRRWRLGGRNVGLALSRAILAFCFLMLITRLAASPLHLLKDESQFPAKWYNALPVATTDRSMIDAKLQGFPGDHVVIVGYNKEDRSYDWVYNSADIDSQKVIWARDLGPAENAELLRYYEGRHAWYVFPKDADTELTPYRADSSQ